MKELDWTEVSIEQSEIIRGWAYDEIRRELFVRFQRGTTYRYDEVPLAVVQRWTNPYPLTWGQYFHRSIRTQFVYTLVQ